MQLGGSYHTRESSGKSNDGNESTVKLTVDYAMPDGVLSKIKANALAKINEKEAEHLLHNLKTILEME